jgi:hypothetical protein
MFFSYDFISNSIVLFKIFFILNNFQNNFGFQTSFKLISRILLNIYIYIYIYIYIFFFFGGGGGGGKYRRSGSGGG